MRAHGAKTITSTLLGTLRADPRMEYHGYVEPDGYDQVSSVGRQGRSSSLLAGRRGLLSRRTRNMWDANDMIQALVRSGRTVNPDRLADPSVPLDEVPGG